MLLQDKYHQLICFPLSFSLLFYFSFFSIFSVSLKKCFSLLFFFAFTFPFFKFIFQICFKILNIVRNFRKCSHFKICSHFKSWSEIFKKLFLFYFQKIALFEICCITKNLQIQIFFATNFFCFQIFSQDLKNVPVSKVRGLKLFKKFLSNFLWI